MVNPFLSHFVRPRHKRWTNQWLSWPGRGAGIAAGPFPRAARRTLWGSRTRPRVLTWASTLLARIR